MALSVRVWRLKSKRGYNGGRRDHAMSVRAKFKIIKSSYDTWEGMARQVAEALTALGPERVIGVSHSQETHTGVIIVWYWEADDGEQG